MNELDLEGYEWSDSDISSINLNDNGVTIHSDDTENNLSDDDIEAIARARGFCIFKWDGEQ